MIRATIETWSSEHFTAKTICYSISGSYIRFRTCRCQSRLGERKVASCSLVVGSATLDLSHGKTVLITWPNISRRERQWAIGGGPGASMRPLWRWLKIPCLPVSSTSPLKSSALLAPRMKDSFEVVDLIDYERNSPLPFTTCQGAPTGPANAFELLQFELEYFLAIYVESNQRTPPNRLLHVEACCIVFGAEMTSQQHPEPPPAASWLRDLLMSVDQVAKEARTRPMKTAARSRFTQLKIHGKHNIFEWCPLEASLHSYIDTYRAADLKIDNYDLQREACAIIQQMPGLSAMFSTLLTDLVWSSSHWLDPFRARRGLVTTRFQSSSLSSGTEQYANEIGCSLSHSEVQDPGVEDQHTVARTYRPDFVPDPSAHLKHAVKVDLRSPIQRIVSSNDSNMYRGLARDLSRFVASATSPLNPNSRIPTDEELQYQARWILYDE